MTYRIGATRVTFRGSQQAAFTLVEVMLVVLILAVVTGLAAPSFMNSFSGIQLRKETDSLAHFMRYAQSTAVTQSKPLVLDIHEQENVYQLFEREESGEIKHLDGRLGRAYSLPEELTLESTSDQFIFYPDGTMDKERVTICLKEKCFIISSQEQRGKIHVFQKEI